MNTEQLKEKLKKLRLLKKKEETLENQTYTSCYRDAYIAGYNEGQIKLIEDMLGKDEQDSYRLGEDKEEFSRHLRSITDPSTYFNITGCE